MRRHDSISPSKSIADAPGEIECWISHGFEEFGQIEALIYKRAAGLSGAACFLIDGGVVGLKNGWSRIGIERTRSFDMHSEPTGCNRLDLKFRR